jgi:hypothetical protein
MERCDARSERHGEPAILHLLPSGIAGAAARKRARASSASELAGLSFSPLSNALCMAATRDANVMVSYP